MSISQRLCRSPLAAWAGSEVLSTFLSVYLGCGILVGSGKRIFLSLLVCLVLIA